MYLMVKYGMRTSGKGYKIMKVIIDLPQDLDEQIRDFYYKGYRNLDKLTPELVKLAQDLIEIIGSGKPTTSSDLD